MPFLVRISTHTAEKTRGRIKDMGAWISFGVILGIYTQDWLATEQKAFLIFPFAWEILRKLLQLFHKERETPSAEEYRDKRSLFQLAEEWSKYIKERRMHLERESAKILEAEEKNRWNGHKRSCTCAACSLTLCSPGLHISADSPGLVLYDKNARIQ